tara:strand:- start:587 stop:826 length:240 start_codon:yes stop_codon:yes gene_type:complete
MKYQLVMKNTGEVITVTDRKVFGLNEAKSYYIRMKHLKEKDFDKLYIVEEYKLPESLRGDTGNWNDKWWKEESTGLDDF